MSQENQAKRSLVSLTGSKVFCSMENVTWIETMKGRECGVTSSPPTIAVARLLWRRWRRRNRKDMILLSACAELNSAETEISNVRRFEETDKTLYPILLISHFHMI